MNRVLFGIASVLVATSPGAQDKQMTDAQLAAKCEAGGGCVIVTRDELNAVIDAALNLAYKQGLRDCNNNI